MKVQRALISVSDKSGLEDLVRVLNDLGVEILSTGGTAKKIKEFKVPVKDVSDHTGFPEMMDGRVKTLHPAIHGGLLALRGDKAHMGQAKKHGIGMIDLVVVNLYPFEETVARPGVQRETAIENIDIGGPSMIRSAAKNHASVAVVTSPDQYAAIIEELKENKGTLGPSTMEKLAVQAFAMTAAYDTAIHGYLVGSRESGAGSCKKEVMPDKLTLSFEKVQDLRYGENPHQKGAFYKNTGIPTGIAAAKKIQGKELSFNNIMDLDAAVAIAAEFTEPAAAIIKHTNPCGAATAKTLKEAYEQALACDRQSAFGSIIAFNRAVDRALADYILKDAGFVECLIAPSFDEQAKTLFAIKKNVRLLELADLTGSEAAERHFRKINGGLLLQDPDHGGLDRNACTVVTEKKPDARHLDALFFAWRVVKHVKSNAIVIADGTRTVGIGAGQMSRVDSVRIAIEKAAVSIKGAVLASDAFFPMPDSIDCAHEAGIAAIIQPGGSIRDKDVIAACDKHGIAMVFTGKRHFKH